MKVQVSNSLLSKKGLLVTNGSLHIMNESFRNFIYNIGDYDMITKLKKKLKTQGTWAKYRLIILFVLIAMASFMFIPQKVLFTTPIAFTTL